MDRVSANRQILENEYQGIDTDIETLLQLRHWYQEVIGEYGIGFGHRADIGEALLSLDFSTAMAIRQMDVLSHIQALDQVLVNLSNTFTDYEPLKDEQSSINGMINDLQKALNAAIQPLQGIVTHGTVSVNDLTLAKERLAEQLDDCNQYHDNPVASLLSEGGLTLSVNHGGCSPHNFALAKNTFKIIRKLEALPHALQCFCASSDNARYRDLKQDAEEIVIQHHHSIQAMNDFETKGQVDMEKWLDSENGNLCGIIERNKKTLAKPEWLETWLAYLRLKTNQDNAMMIDVMAKLEAGEILSEKLVGVVKYLAFHQLAKEVFELHPKLRKYSGMEQSAIVDSFKREDRNLITLQRQLIAHKATNVKIPKGNSTGNISQYTELSLIKHNMGLIKPKISIRSLLTRARQSIQTLKPCFLMSPMSVAQYLEQGKLDFNIVIIDEASQMRPEDALGAIARGKSLVVVGDPRQLPPTSFFQKRVNDTETDEASAFEVSESILDAVMPLFKNRRLRWHYRSRHESLIAFSNKHFYQSNLVLFPSQNHNDKEFGIQHEFVDGCVFNDKKNIKEANVVLEVIISQLQLNPQESVGVVAMNANQRDEIEYQLEQRVKTDPVLQQFYSDNQQSSEPLFIKNLENAQGDERDVIIISMTYGPNIAGASSMHQRFGAINSAAGHRRLNVLLTRSKKRMHIITSMISGYIRTDANSSSGVKALKDFLEYCETGQLDHYDHTNRPPQSDFEIAVMAMLAQHGYECEPQLGVTGYYLDLAVIDPGMPGRFLMGIECDGASYHSAKSTRDRDRLRQEILEDLGWRIMRIWSTDWFNNPETQLNPIIRKLENLKTVNDKPNDDFHEDNIVHFVNFQGDEHQHLNGQLPLFDNN